MTAVLPDPSSSRAVLVGISQYQQLADLPAVRNNLYELRALLRDSARWGLPRQHCTVVDQPTTSRRVLDLLHEQASRATDTLLFYFAGHGLIDERDDDELFLALPNADPKRPNRDAIPYSWIRNEFLDASSARRKIVIIDCCYSGRALGTWMSDGAPLPDGLEIFGTCVLTATARTKLALAPSDQRFTAFTGELIEALRQGIPDGPELLDLDTLYRFADRRLRARGWPRPKRGELDNGGLVAIGRNIASQPGVASVADGATSSRPTHDAPAPPKRQPPRSAPDRPRKPAPAAAQAAGPPRRVVIPVEQITESDRFENVFGAPRLSNSDRLADLTLSLSECVFGTRLELVLDGRADCVMCRGGRSPIQIRCAACRGTGTSKVQEVVQLRVPPGTRGGGTLRVRGKGNEATGRSRGDLYLTIREAHGPLRRDGDNLHYRLSVSMAVAALGANLDIPVLDRVEKVRLNRGTQTNTTIVLQGKGLPRADGNGSGNLELHIDVPTPKALTERQRDLLNAFIAARPQDRAKAFVSFRGLSATLPMAIAAVGTTLEFDISSGGLRIHLEPGTQHGAKVPYGDLLSSNRQGELEVEVVVPAPNSARERELLRAFALDRGDFPRPPAPPPRVTPPPPRAPEPDRSLKKRLRGFLGGPGATP